MSNAKQILTNAGCVLKGEFIVALKEKGMVASTYVNCDPILVGGKPLMTLIQDMIYEHRAHGPFEFIASPGTGGIPLCVNAAAYMLHIHARDDIFHPFTEKDSGGNQVFHRQGFAKSVEGKRGLVLEDVVSSGGSVLGTCESIRRAGGEVMGVSALWSRGDADDETFNAPFRPLVREKITSYLAEHHPYWGEWPLATDVGHPEHLEGYPGGTTTILS